LRLLLDTTYFLPAVGVTIKGFPEDTPMKLIENGHKISISEITIFELSAKGAKYVATGTLTAERAARGIRAIIYDERITGVPMYDSSVLNIAFSLRKILSDFIDCLILSSALNQSDVLVTEDEDMQNLRKRREFQELLQKTNPKFEIRTLADML